MRASPPLGVFPQKRWLLNCRLLRSPERLAQANRLRQLNQSSKLIRSVDLVSVALGQCGLRTRHRTEHAVGDRLAGETNLGTQQRRLAVGDVRVRQAHSQDSR